MNIKCDTLNNFVINTWPIIASLLHAWCFPSLAMGESGLGITYNNFSHLRISRIKNLTFLIYQQYSKSNYKSSTKNEWAYSDSIFSNLYIPHNSYGTRVNCIYFVNNCPKKAPYLLEEYICISKKNLFFINLEIILNENWF